MPFESDRTPRTDSAQARIQTSNTPNTGVKEGDFAFLVQRADVPKDFKGLIDSVYELGSAALKPYLDPLSARLDDVELGLALFEEADPIATEAVAELQAVVDTLPTAEALDTVKESVKTVQEQYKQLDTTKANQADLEAAQAAIKALQDALAALPPAGATPEQLAAIDVRVKALETVLSTAENSKGILNQDVRSHFLVAGNLFGGVRRLVSSDIDRLNQRGGYEAENPYRALDGIGQTGLANASNQWLTWFAKTTMRVWRIEVTHINNNWAVRTFKRNGTTILNLTASSGTYTAIYKPKASTGHEAFTSMQFVDDGANTAISNLYASVTDSANPAAAPVIAGTTLKVGDRFRFQTVDGVSALFNYQGIDSASGAWKATPVKATADSNIALHTEIDPILDAHGTAIAALESQVAEVGNTITRRENRALEEGDITGDWHYWIQYSPLFATAIWRKWEWIGENNAALLFDRVVPRDLSKAAATYDETTKLYSLTFDGLQFQFATEGTLRFQMPGADSKFTNLSWKAFAADGTEIGNGGGTVAVVDPANPTFNTNIQANPAVAQGRAIAKIRYTLTPITGAEFSFEVAV